MSRWCDLESAASSDEGVDALAKRDDKAGWIGLELSLAEPSEHSRSAAATEPDEGLSRPSELQLAVIDNSELLDNTARAVRPHELTDLELRSPMSRKLIMQPISELVADAGVRAAIILFRDAGGAVARRMEAARRALGTAIERACAFMCVNRGNMLTVAHR